MLQSEGDLQHRKPGKKPLKEFQVLFIVPVLEIFFVYIQKAYSAAWEKIKAKSYNIPHDSHALVHAKQQKVILSNVSPFFCPFSSA